MHYLTNSVVALGFLVSINVSHAGNGEMKPTDHLRQAKAEMFDKMATCLKSEKSEADCEKDLKQNCLKMGGMKDCGMSSMASKGKRMAKGAMGNPDTAMPDAKAMPPDKGMGMEDDKEMMGGEM